MKKDKKKHNIFKNKLKGLRPGDRVFASYKSPENTMCNTEGIIEDMGDTYIVIDRYMIHHYELSSINKI